MGWVTIRDLGQLGLITDVPAHELPPNAWTSVANARFEDEFAGRAHADAAVKGTLSGTPYFVLPFLDNGLSPVWAYSTLTAIYAADNAGGASADITRNSGPYTGTVDNEWNGGWLNGVGVLTNGVDAPQSWNPVGSGTLLVDLPNWPASTTCKIIRPIRNYLMAFDVTKSGTRYSTLIKWSGVALPGSVPTSWDETDKTVDAGELALAHTPGQIIDAVPFRDNLLALKKNSMILVEWIPGNDVFRIVPQTARLGVLGTKCAMELFPGQLVMVTNEGDVVLTNGRDVKPLADKRVLRKFQSEVNEAFVGRAFLALDERFDSLLFCYPSGSAEIPNKALVWNWRQDRWSYRDIPQSYSAGSGRDVDATGGSLLGHRTIFGDVANDKLRRYGDGGGQIGGSNFTTTLQRDGLAIIGFDRFGNPRVDFNVMKVVTGIRPIIEAPAPFVMNVFVGTRNDRDDPIDWDGPYTFDSRTDDVIDTFAQGRSISVKFESQANVDWKLYGYSMLVETAGTFF